MALADYVPARAEVKAGRVSFQVRGLGLDDISRLIAEHRADVELLAQLYEDSTRDIYATTARNALVVQVIQRAPEFVRRVILLASDDESEAAERAVKALPFPVTIDALLKVGNLTFEDVGGAGNFVATLATLLGSVLPEDVVARFQTGATPLPQAA